MKTSNYSSKSNISEEKNMTNYITNKNEKITGERVPQSELFFVFNDKLE